LTKKIVIREAVREAVELTNVNTYGSITAANNTAGFSVSLEVAHRAHVEVWVKLGGAGDIKVYGSRNGSDWRLVDSDSLSAAGEWHKGYLKKAISMATHTLKLKYQQQE